MGRPNLRTVPRLPSPDEYALDIAIAEGYRQLAARTVYEAVLDVKSNTPPADKSIVPAYDFLVSPWGLFLAAGRIAPDIMRPMAEGYYADIRRFWAYGLDALGAQLELEDQMEEIVEKELYTAWTQSKKEQQRYRKMKRERKCLTTAGNLL